MTLTMQDVMTDSVLERTDPTVEAGADGLGGTVRWAYTNERYDIASFLSGGELVIIEGSALLGHMNDAEVARYVDTLVDADVAGLAIELVEGVRSVPPAMVRRADERGLPVIGMHRRVPFVDLCQSINTAIVKDQLLVQVRTDTIAVTLRSRLTAARSARDVAKILNDTFGESVVIFDSDGLVVAHGGPSIRVADDRHPAERTLVLDVRKNGAPLASIEITQRNRLADGRIIEQVAEPIRQVLPAFVQAQARNAMLAHVMKGPDNGYHATDQEADDASAMMQALWDGRTRRPIPFAIGMDSVSSSIDMVSQCLSGAGHDDAPDENDVVELLEGNVLFGLYAVQDGRDEDAAARFRPRLAAAAAVPGTWCVCGRPAPTTRMLLDECGLLQFAVRSTPPAPGTVANLLEAAPKRLLGIERTRDAAAVLQTLMLGDTLPNQNTLMHTLTACFDTGGNISQACEALGIRRQTLYNRLAKITELTGVGKEDHTSWPLLLCAAKLAEAARATNRDSV